MLYYVLLYLIPAEGLRIMAIIKCSTSVTQQVTFASTQQLILSENVSNHTWNNICIIYQFMFLYCMFHWLKAI